MNITNFKTANITIIGAIATLVFSALTATASAQTATVELAQLVPSDPLSKALSKALTALLLNKQ
jgi:hypothetical protein